VGGWWLPAQRAWLAELAAITVADVQFIMD
jgi:hypothetical protein